MTAEHPGREELQAYGQGRLAPGPTLALEAHLARCASCCELVEQAPGDGFLTRLRAAGPASSGRAGDTEAVGAASPPAPAVPPELVDHPRYRVLGLVGQGGMGAVYRAEHRRMERTVALKVINPALMRHPAAAQRFQQEVRAAARLHHANIVHAYDADQAGALHFLVMEYVEGTTLAELVRQRGPLPVAEACAFARQAALGLQHAHEHGLVKVLDFGLALLPRTADGQAAAFRKLYELKGEKQKEFGTAYRYLRKRMKYMRYAEYRRVGVPRGSGVTEAGCKTVYTQRMKLSGMRWQKAGGQTVLNLRVLQLSGAWDDAYRGYLSGLKQPQVRGQEGPSQDGDVSAA